MSSSDRYNTGPGDLIQQINDLKKRIEILETTPRAINTAIDMNGMNVNNGSIRIFDSTAVKVAQIGKQDNGEFGISVLEPGQVFHQIPYVYAQSIAAQETCSSTSFVDLTTVGPRLTVPVRSSGRVLVMISSNIQWISTAFAAAINGGGYATVDFSGANVISANTVSNSFICANVSNITVSAGTIAQASGVVSTGAFVFSGLNPGATTITMKYSQTTAGQNVDYGRRTLTVVTL